MFVDAAEVSDHTGNAPQASAPGGTPNGECQKALAGPGAFLERPPGRGPPPPKLSVGDGWVYACSLRGVNDKARSTFPAPLGIVRGAEAPLTRVRDWPAREYTKI